MSCRGSGKIPPEVTRFLREHPPFDAFDPDAAERVAAGVEVEFHRAGTVIFAQRAEPVEHVRVVRTGLVEIVHDGSVLDLLGEGELFGHASMLTGLPPGFEARAVEDTLCYRFEAELVRELLAQPAGVRFVARSLLETGAELHGAERGGDDAEQPVRALVRAPPVICDPDTTIQQAARRMTEASAGAVVVRLGDGTIGLRAIRGCCASWPASRCPTARPRGSSAGSWSSTRVSTAGALTSNTVASSRSSTWRAGRRCRPG